jgi:multidrug resistance efflux pump
MELFQTEDTTVAKNGDEQAIQKEKVAGGSLQLRSMAAQDMLSRKSGFLEKWALLLFLGLLLLLVAGSWFIHYPDTIQAAATLNAKNAPKEIYTHTEGRLIKLFVRNDETIAAGQTIGIMESNANSAEVLSLSNKLGECLQLITRRQFKEASSLFNIPYQKLGELQEPYQAFILHLQEFNDYLVNDFYTQKKTMLQEDIASIKDLNHHINLQMQLTKEDLKLSKESYDINSQLQLEKVISKEELKNYQSKLIGKKISIPILDASLINNNNQLREKRKELIQLEHDMAQQVILFTQALQTIKSQAEEWRRRYIISSPIAGRIVFLSPVEENQHLQNNKLIAFVNPDDSKFYAEVYLSQLNFGKIDTGLQVYLRFDAYPFQEYGQVPGKLTYISRIGTDSGFHAIIDLSVGLKTTRWKEIQYKSGLKANAIIVTRNYRLLERLYYSIIKETSKL